MWQYLCLHLSYILLWPLTRQEMVVNSAEKIYFFVVNFREFSEWTTHCFVFNQLWLDWPQRYWDSEAGLFVYLPTRCLVNTKYISLPSQWASLHLCGASGDSWHLANQRPVLRSRDMTGPMRGPGLRGQVTRSSSERLPGQPVPSITLPSASRARGNIQQNMR